MKIELNEFEFAAKDFFRLFMRAQMVQTAWIGGLPVALFAGILIPYGIVFWLAASLALFAFLTAIVYAQTYYIVFSKDNRTIFQKRKIVFDDKMVSVAAEDGSESKAPIENILRANKCSGYYRLYINRYAFVPIPWSAFESEEQRMRFETEILGERLRQRFPYKFLIIYFFACVLLVALGYGFHVLTADPPSEQEASASVQE